MGWRGGVFVTLELEAFVRWNCWIFWVFLNGTKGVFVNLELMDFGHFFLMGRREFFATLEWLDFGFFLMGRGEFLLLQKKTDFGLFLNGSRRPC